MKRINLFFAILQSMLLMNGLVFAQDTTLTVTSAGNVGIGTTSPQGKLDVYGHIRMSNPSSFFMMYDGALNRVALKVLPSERYVAGGLEIGRGFSTVYIPANVGIGTMRPQGKLDVYGHIRMSNPSSFFMMYDGALNRVALNVLPSERYIAGGLKIGGGFSTVYIPGNVGIGTQNPRGTLDVNGSIFQRGSMLHADYVFEPDYQLESIEEHAEFMWKNKHLKAIPKAKVDKNGREIVEVGAHRKGIVEELEKAHIYIEQLHNRIKILEATINKLATRLAGND